MEVELSDGSTDRIPFGTCIWATGIAMHPLVALLKEKLPEGLQASRRGLLVDSHLRVLGSQGTIFCLGDAAVTGATPATALPPTAQVARQQGEYLAGLLSKHQLALLPEAQRGAAAAAGQDLVPLPQEAKPFRYLHLGALAYLGEQKGVMDLPVRGRGGRMGQCLGATSSQPLPAACMHSGASSCCPFADQAALPQDAAWLPGRSGVAHAGDVYAGAAGCLLV